MYVSRILLAAAVGVSSMTMVGCMSDTPETATEQRALKSEAQAALAKMYERDHGLRNRTERAYGYAIFPSVGKGGVIVGGAAGRGEVFEQGRLVGYAALNAASVGAQIGGQEFSQLILFENEDALRRFQNTETAVTLNASAVALKAGAADEAHFQDGVMIFTLPTGGFMAEASVAGQSFKYEPLSSANARIGDRETRDMDAENASYRVRSETDVDRNADGTHRQERKVEVKSEVRD